MQLDHLIHKFTLLGSSARVGHGPESLEDPNFRLAEQTRRWLDVHPFLQRDKGYIDFLRYYSGAEVDDAGTGFGIAIAGFTGIGGYLHEFAPYKFDDSKPCLTEERFYPFATVGGRFKGGPVKNFVAVSFSFDATGTREWGVYRGVYPQKGTKSEEQWYCRTFLEWLERAVELKGNFI